MKELKVRVTFMEEILGTASNDPEIHAEFIAMTAYHTTDTQTHRVIT